MKVKCINCGKRFSSSYTENPCCSNPWNVKWALKINRVEQWRNRHFKTYKSLARRKRKKGVGE